jgi:hypothetical protein
MHRKGFRHHYDAVARRCDNIGLPIIAHRHSTALVGRFVNGNIPMDRLAVGLKAFKLQKKSVALRKEGSNSLYNIFVARFAENDLFKNTSFNSRRDYL